MANRLIQLTCLMSCMAFCLPTWGQSCPPNGQQMQYTHPYSLQHPEWLADPLHCQLPMGNGMATHQPVSADVKPLPYLPGGPVPVSHAVPGQRYSHGDGHITHYASEIDPCDPWEEETAFERYLHKVMNNSWIRIDYLNWTIKRPGGTPVGHESYLNIVGEEIDSSEFWTYSPTDEHSYLWFPEFYDVTTTTRPINLDEISLSDTPGIRGTWGVPTTFGEVQISAFTLEQNGGTVLSDDGDSRDMTLYLFGGLNADEYPWGETRLDIVYHVPTTNQNGEIQQPIFAFDILDATYTSDVWGADYKLYFDMFMTKQTGLIMRPLIGFEFMSIKENMGVRGISFNIVDDEVIITHDGSLNVNSSNNLYGGLVGINLEVRHEKFLIGIEPKGMFGFNNYRTRIQTLDFATSDEGAYEVNRSKSEFNAMLDLQIYAKVHCTKNFDLFVAYDLKYAGKVARPGTQIEYELGDSDETAFRVGNQLEQFSVDGLSIGGELRFY